MTSILSARDLCAFYGDSRVLHGLDLDVEEGGVTALLGANGAGKTSTLRALSGMIRTTGKIDFAGQSVAGCATEQLARLGIAHVPQGRGTFSRMTSEENLQLGAIARRDRAGIAADIKRAYGYFPKLRERARQQAGTMSGRRAADAGHCPRADDAAPSDAARRALVRASAADC
jgi:branched-chain amino acid transport system ATP-binding protein